MATATKPRKKAAPKPAPTPESEAELSARELRQARDDDLREKVVEMRDEESKWDEIAEALDIKPGKAMMLYMQAEADANPKQKITWKTDEELAEKVVKARRDDQLSWGQISARTGLSEGKLKRIFAEQVGDEAHGHRIGKGGRFPAGMAPAPKPAKATKASKNGTPTKGTAKKPLSKCDAAELNERMPGKKLRVTRNGKETLVGVKSVAETDGTTVSIVDTSGKTRSFKFEEFTLVTPAK